MGWLDDTLFAWKAAAGAFVALGAALVAYAAVGRFGFIVIALPVALVAAALLVSRPAWTLGILLVATVMCEYRATGLLSPTKAFYEPAVVLSPSEMLIALLVAGVVLDASRRGRFRTPEPFTVPLLLLAVAIAVGIVTGYYGGADLGVIRSELRTLGLVVLLPFLVVNVVRGPDALHLIVKIAAVLVAVKGVIGLIVIIRGEGTAAVLGQSLAYYEPTANWLMMAFLLVVLAAVVTRSRISPWVFLVIPVAVAVLILSYRRAYWIGVVVGLAVVVVIATGPLGRRLLPPAVAVLVVGVWLAFSTGVVTELEGPVVTRAKSLDPRKLATNRYDSYRTAERRNIWADVTEHPLTGIGLGVPWTARYPTPVDYPNARVYTHFVSLWYWLKLGLLGFAAYLWLMGAAIWTAAKIARARSDPLMTAVGFGLVGALVGQVVVEMTESDIGVDPPYTVVIAAIFGLLAVARADLVPAAESARPAPARGVSERPAV